MSRLRLALAFTILMQYVYSQQVYYVKTESVGHLCTIEQPCSNIQQALKNYMNDPVPAVFSWCRKMSASPTQNAQKYQSGNNQVKQITQQQQQQSSLMEQVILSRAKTAFLKAQYRMHCL